MSSDEPVAAPARARTSDVTRRLDRHEKRISALESVSLQLLGEVKGMRADLQELGKDMREVVRTLAENAARQPLDYMPRDQVREEFQREREAREELARHIEKVDNRLTERDGHNANRGHMWAVTWVSVVFIVAAAVAGAVTTVVLTRLIGH